MPTLMHDRYVNCAWCNKVRDRVTHEPLAEPLQTIMKAEIQSHGMCEPCGTTMREQYLAKKAAEAAKGSS